MVLLKDLFCTTGENYSVGKNKPIFKHIQEVDTGLEYYHIGQIGDILQGVILNELMPTQNRWKKKIRNYVKGQLEIPSLLPEYWKILSRRYQNQEYHKYQVWYWTPEME